MVFESIVVDILNKFLGNYVENLDRSQLKIGIWGGDVSLKNLSLKPSALDELDLPVKTIYGHLGKLVLKIPWKNIYTAPVEVSVENLFLLVNPIQDVVYDPVKEEKLKQETKQALINQVEMAKKVEKEKDGNKVDDTFVEKLAAQIIKNVQIFIQNIHIRYEDRVTKPERPFSIGISLHTLNVFTTNESCDRYILPQETSPIFYKIMKMDGLSIYWNTNQKLFIANEAKDSPFLKLFVDGIASKEESSSNYNYVLGPINAEAKLQINSKPEMINFLTPKMYLSLVLDQLLVHLSRSQYQDFIALLESFDRMSKAAPYRKYRPKLDQYRGHYKEWWKFAIACVLEEEIKRTSRNWDWNVLKAHRELMKKYKIVYRAKLTEKPNDTNQRELTNLENQLDAFNIILMRQKVENEVEREGRLIAQQKSKKGGWFSGWFSSDKTQPDATAGSGNDIVKKLENAMTDEEKEKLYRAIDYHENSAPAMYPKSFIAIRLEFILKIFRILVTDDYVPASENNDLCPVLCIEFKDAFVSLHQRPAAQSLALAIKMQTFQTLGLSQKNIVPQIIKSKLSGMRREQSDAFFDIYFETNPEDENYDQKLHVTLRPLKVVYDAQTIIRVLEVFTPEKDISNVKDQLQAAANTKLEEMKEKSTMRLQYAIEKSTRLDLKIDLMAPYLILPHGGLYTKNEKALVLNLGRITVSSVDKDGVSCNVRRMLSSGKNEDEVLQQLMIDCYDHFNITLSEVQILSLKAGESWRPKLEDTIVVDINSDAHILQPTSLHIDIYKCLIDDDPRLPKMKIDGDLPDITIKITDQKLLEVVSLLLSVPLPQTSSLPAEEVQPETKDDFGSSIYDSAMSLRQRLETVNKMPFSTLRKYNRQNEASAEHSSNDDSKLLIDYINLEANFRLKTLTVYVTSGSSDVPVIEASVFGLELTFKQKNYSSEIFSKLGKISLTQGYQNTSIPAINTPLTTKDGEQYLFCCRLLIVDKSSPLFAEFYDSTAITMSLDFTKLYIVAHQEAILNTIEWVNSVQNRVTTLIAQGSNVSQANENKPETVRRRKTSSVSNASTFETHRKKLKTKSKLAAIVEDHLSETNTNEGKKQAVSTKETTELKISLQLDVIQMCIQTASRPIASMDIDGFQAAFTVQKSSTNINLILESISVCDLSPNTIYNKVAYISEGKNAFQAAITLNNDAKKESTQSEGFDVLARVRVNCLQCVFINEFVVNLLEFSNNFQTSKQILADASAAAVASAKMNMQQVYQSSTRISFDIFAEAPLIVVPRNNQSDEIFIIDFGNLSVKNSLKSLTRDQFGHIPLIDEISASLEDMKIVRTNFARTQVETVLLKPVNYTLVIKRNLSSSWYHDVPDLDIDGVFHSIHVEITDKDYKLLMQTLNENIAATQSTNASKSVSPVSASEVTKSDVEIDSSEKEQTETVEVHLESYDEVVRMMMRFSMAIESVTIDLFSGVKENNENDGLAKFTLALLSVKGSILTNGDMSIHAFLSDCCLDDTRSAKITNEVKRYMKRKSAEEISCSNKSGQLQTAIRHNSSSSSLDVSLPSSSYESSSRSMIDVTIQKKQNRTDVNARVFSFILIFNIDYLMQIKDFFLSEFASTSVSASSPSTTDVKKTAAVANAAEIQRNQSTGSSVTHCNVVIEKPDIILVENLDNINTNAIVLNNEAMLKIQLDSDGQLALNGSLKNLQLYSCCYNPELRSQTTSLILHPLTVDVSGSTDEDKCLHLDVNVSELMISVTAGTIELLTKISTTLIPNVQNESSFSDVAQKDYSSIWQQKAISDDYWFLRAEKGVDAMTLYSEGALQSNNVNQNRKDVILIAVPTVGITLEAGVGKKTMPVLALKSSFFGTVEKSFYSMNIESCVTLEMAYYNARLALWEPVMEPVASPHSGSGISSYSPWKLEMNIIMLNQGNEDINQDASSPVEDVPDNLSTLSIEKVSTPPAFSLNIKSNERIEVTITKTCMDVIRTLTQSFNNAVYLKSSNLTGLNEAGFSSYKFINDFGVEVEVSLKADKHLQATDNTGEPLGANLCEKVAVNSGEDVTLFMKREGGETRKFGETDKLCLLDKLNMITDKKRFFFDINILERNKNLLLPISRADKRFFAIRGQSSSSNGNSLDSWGLISEVEIIDGSVITTLRSVVQIHNHFNVNITVHYLKNDKLCDAGIVSPSQHLNLPVHAVYGTKNQLFFAPERFSMSNESFVWKDIEKNISLSKQLQCQAKNAENEDPFFIRVLGEMEPVYYENTSTYTIASTSYIIHLRPTVILKNFLPVSVVCCLQGIGREHTLKPGERMNISSAEPNHSTIVLRLDNYLDKVWSCKKIITTDSPIFSVWTFTSYDSETPFSLNLGVWYSNSNESMIFALYCPFWMVNKTGLSLSYKGVEDGGMILHHPKNFDEPILFSFKEKSFFSKKKACVRVNDGNWSDKFSIDAAGSSGAVTCHHNNKSFPLGVYIMLNSNSLTKQVIFSPFYSLANNCPYAIEFRENQAENVQWITINPGTCIPFWPTVQDDKLKTLELRINGTNEVTTSFSYLKIKTYSLMLLNKYGGLQVDVQVNEGGVYVAASPFNSRMASALIINSTESMVEFSEADLGEVKNKIQDSILQRQPSTNIFRKWQLEAGKEIFFNWSSTFYEKPILLISKSTDSIDLRKDGVGKYSSNEEEGSNFWISFLHGMQRILLLTPDEFLIKRIEAFGDLSFIQQDISLSLEGIGFSLVNNISRQELLYLSISSSGVLWETQEKPGKRFKAVKDHLNERLEEMYVRYCNMVATTDNAVDVDQEIDGARDGKVVVNFSKGLIIRPNSLKLRRTYCSGLWFQIKSSEHYKQIHAKIHRLQVDNQIYDCVFPVIFFPVPPPKSVAVDDSYSRGVEKPFAELSVVQRMNEHSTIKQFKYFKVLIQEFHVKADIGWINCLVKFFEADNITDEEELTLFQKDQEVTKEPLCVYVSSVTSQDFFDSVHFTPFKIHISFSLSGDNPNSGTPQEGLPIVNLLTQSIGVTLTDVNDVVFKLAYFERKHKFYSQTQLLSEVKTHYIGQFVKQLYVLVLGLDVLGNPFGLVTGFKQGVEDFFYEPFQGAIQGPSEFAEGVLLGMRSLFGHTVGGAAGAVGRITGAMGKGIAALTFDEEYQKKRRQRLAHNQPSIREGGRGLLMGVVEGVGGVISKPISGAKEEGVEGFVKGVGKGVVGFFTRPVSGVADFASGTLDVVRRAASFSEEVQRYRLPRFIKENGLVVPYSEKYAQGYKLLLDLDKGRYSNTDYYVFHLHMPNGYKPDKEILLLTNNRVLYVVKPNDVFCENIRVDWQYTWQEINVDGGIGETENGIFIKSQNDCRRPSSFKSLFGHQSKGKVLLIRDPNLRKWLLNKMKELIQKPNH